MGRKREEERQRYWKKKEGRERDVGRKREAERENLQFKL